MEHHNKVCVAIHTLKDSVQFAFTGEVLTEADFNKINWKTSFKELKKELTITIKSLNSI